MQGTVRRNKGTRGQRQTCEGQGEVDQDKRQVQMIFGGCKSVTLAQVRQLTMSRPCGECECGRTLWGGPWLSWALLSGESRAGAGSCTN